MVPPYMGRVMPRTYPPIIVTTHPLKTLGFVVVVVLGVSLLYLSILV